MKISLSWVFDHILNVPLNAIAITELVDRFIQTTAEVENVVKIQLPLDRLRFGVVMKSTDTKVELFDETNNETIGLSTRVDSKQKSGYLIIKDEKNYRWATHKDFFSQKEGLLPEFYFDAHQLNRWQTYIEPYDYILTIDNKSITHRPDLWSHRGIAREIAALYNFTLKPLDTLLKEIPESSKAHSPIKLSLDASAHCMRVSGYAIEEIKSFASLPLIAYRLAAVDARVINGLVDLTNYVMLDIGQPMHAFSLEKLSGKQLTIRLAKDTEKILLLDDTVLDLTEADIIVADEEKPVSLAGIMGGKLSAVNENTKQVYLESANFDAATIRKSALLHRKRTESSARFEKSLDAHQTTQAIQRYVKLLDQFAIPYTANKAITTLGTLAKSSAITIEHKLIEERIGVELSPSFIENTLEKLEFKVQKKPTKLGIIYSITIPSFRATKDINCKEDIVEEVARFFGYNNIPLEVPLLPSIVRENKLLENLHNIKCYLAYACAMKEVYNYGLFDELFLEKTKYEVSNSVHIKNPISEHWQRLVTSLIPHLVKNVTTNSSVDNQLAFFEYGTIWHQATEIVEKKSLAGIFYQRKQKIDFIENKEYLSGLFALLGLSVSWRLTQQITDQWYQPFKTALIYHDTTVIGIAGLLNSTLLVDPLEGEAFIFELDADYLLNYRAPIKQFQSLLKYPEVTRDISMSLPLSITIDQLVFSISTVDTRVKKVLLIDLYHKKEWLDNKAITLRIMIADVTKTLVKAEVDELMQKIEKRLREYGVTIR